MAEDKKKKSAKNSDSKKTDKKKARKNPFKSMAAFFKGVRSEGKKVIWPGPKEVFKNTLVVLVVILIVGVIIFGIDQALAGGMKLIKNQANKETTTAAETTTEPTTAEVVEENTEADTTAATTETTTKAAD